jgi:FMN-dependent oxidoreductase (nitrilotriacetate monooxygenase family)
LREIILVEIIVNQEKHIKLGFHIEGAGRTWSDWRHPDATPNASTNIQYYCERAKIAEAGKLDFIFVADSLSVDKHSSPHYLNRFEPLTILSALAGVTSHIGLVGTVTTTYSEPFNVARQFASLDHISEGRAGWNVVTSWLEGTADNFGKSEHLEHSLRYRVADEHLRVVQGLWDSWEDDAFVYDKGAGIFFDPDKLNTLNHVGEFFKVKGPLNIARSRQGQPVIFQAGLSETGRNFAARYATGIFAAPSTFDEAVAFRIDVRGRAQRFGRDPNEIFVMPQMGPIVGSTEEEAKELLMQRAELTPIGSALSMLGLYFGDHDFTQYELDAPFPDVVGATKNSGRGRVLTISAAAKSEGLTLRQVALRYASETSDFVGSPKQVADNIENWVDSGAVDGFILHETMPGQLARFTQTVVPLLQARGLFRRDYEGSTLREHLGVEVPPNRNTVRKSKPELF